MRIVDRLRVSARGLLQLNNDAGGSAMISKPNLTTARKAETPDPLQLAHINSELCWCDPILDFDEDGNQSLTHNEVTWN